MKKPSFGVTSFAVLTLSVIGVFRVIYAPLLPSSPTEYLVTVPQTEPLPAPIVEINWRRTIEDGRVEAKRRKLGLFIMFLDPASFYAKEIEVKIFRDPEMARFVNRNFVPVKVNLDQYPEWGQAILPLQRLVRYYDPGVELVVTTQDGTLVDRYGIDDPFQYNGIETVLPFLIKAKTTMSEGLSALDSEKSLKSLQASDASKLKMAEAEPIPAYSDFSLVLQRELNLGPNGSLVPGSTKISGMALRTLAKLGKLPLAALTVEQLAKTPLYDVIDGGFFREAKVDPSSVIVDTSKSTRNNALSALVIAQISCARNNRELKALAIDIGNGILTELVAGDSMSASRLNDQENDLRSRRSSLTNRRLSETLTSAEQKSLLTFVTRSKSNSQDIGSFLSLSALTNPIFIHVRQTLREKIRYSPGLSEPDHISVDGYVAARLFDIFRYTGDSRFLKKARELAEQVYSAQKDGVVAKVFGNREFGPGWLGSYLAVADCGLSNYAATGEIYPLRNGELAMKSAIAKFRDPQTGLLDNTAVNPLSIFEFSSAIPDLADRGRESLNSQALRLAYHYSVTAETEESRSEFFDFAQSVMVRLDSVMHHANSTASGFYDAAFDITTNQAVLVKGPNRVSISNELAKKMPFNVIYPMSEGVVPTRDQIFIRRGEVLEGPFSADEIQKKLVVVGRSYPG